MSIKYNFEKVNKTIPNNVQLVTVTKYSDLAKTNEAIKSGAKILGDSRTTDILNKAPDLLPCSIHMIGHLQSNKVKDAVKY